jgi:hypothetical protein
MRVLIIQPTAVEICIGDELDDYQSGQAGDVFSILYIKRESC